MIVGLQKRINPSFRSISSTFSRKPCPAMLEPRSSCSHCLHIHMDKKQKLWYIKMRVKS